MIELFDEFKNLVTALEQAGLEYAVCGGLALSIHGLPRATVDMDFLIPAESLEQVTSLARSLGFTLKAMPMTFAGGAVRIHRVSKVDADTGDIFVLDLLLVSPQTQQVWETREKLAWENGIIQVVSRDGLIALKTLRGSGQDLVDIQRLQEGKA
jgi:hypothetical protein